MESSIQIFGLPVSLHFNISLIFTGQLQNMLFSAFLFLIDLLVFSVFLALFDPSDVSNLTWVIHSVFLPQLNPLLDFLLTAVVKQTLLLFHDIAFLLQINQQHQLIKSFIFYCLKTWSIAVKQTI